MKERSTLQPFAPGDVFVGSTVLDGENDDQGNVDDAGGFPAYFDAPDPTALVGGIGAMAFGTRFGLLCWFRLALILGLFPALCCALVARLCAHFGARALCCAPPIWVACEWARLGAVEQHRNTDVPDR